jgi:hypothetical protein
VTLDATINPDFSQVESDAFQVEVNQRFPVFFSEKRPFFMEGAGLFTLAGSGMDSSMIAAVHTRRIVNPKAGIKLTGSAGRLQFGTLTAVDDAPEFPGVAPPPDRVFNVARMQYSLGPSNYVGAIATDMEAGSQFNRVAGGDLSLRVGTNQRVTGMLLYSASQGPEGAGREGVGASTSWGYSTRRQQIQGFFEHYDRGFRMDTAFYNRVGITSGWGYTDWSFYPDSAGTYGWIRRIVPFVFTQHGQDRLAGGDETTVVPGVRMNFTRQGFLRIDKVMGHERWQGGRYPLSRPRVQGEVQLFRWMRMSGRADWGNATFYDETAPFRGWSRSTSFDVSWQPTARLSQSLGYRRVDFRRADTRARVYDLDLLNTRTTFQFTRRFFLRGIAQYDSLRARVLADLLASYELRPGTVAHAGYGSLHERRAFVDETWVPGSGHYLTTRRGFFLKASYLYRF